MTVKINYQEEEEGEEGHKTEGGARKTSESYSEQSKQRLNINTSIWYWVCL